MHMAPADSTKHSACTGNLIHQLHVECSGQARGGAAFEQGSVVAVADLPGAALDVLNCSCGCIGQLLLPLDQVRQKLS
jgi:hypothetical protein